MVLEQQIQKYVEKHHLVKMKYGVDTLLNEKERMWKSTLDKDLWYSESEIHDLIINEEINKAEHRLTYEECLKLTDNELHWYGEQL